MKFLSDHFAAIAMSLALIVCTSIHSCSTRYSHCDGMWSLDHWTGSVKKR